MKEQKASCLLLIAAILVIPISTTLSGYTMSVMWGWFVVPAFGAHELRIPFAIGIASIISYITYQYIDTEKSSGESANEKIITAIVTCLSRPLIGLAFGWIVQKFI